QRKKNAWWGEVKHHGVINFYTTIQRGKHNLEWVEFNATFTHGKLEKIELVDNHFTDTTENDTAIEKMFAESDRRRSIWYLKYYDKFTNNCWRIKNRFKNWLIKWINKI
ncbi:MAG: hypothetical protein Q8O88_02170, partial [bacterium]|nr:hypothetical protein [bacterium]